MASSRTLVTWTKVLQEATMHLWNSLIAAKVVNRQIGKSFVGDVETGGTVTIKKPFKFRSTANAAVGGTDNVDLLQRSDTVSVATRKKVVFHLTSQELTVDYFKEHVSEEILKPAMETLGNDMDVALLSNYTGFYNQVGTPGTDPNSFLVIRQAAQRLTEEGVPKSDRSCILSPGACTGLADHLKNYMSPKIVEGVVQSGYFAHVAGFDLYEDANVQVHTSGTGAGTSCNVNGAGSELDTTIAIEALGASETITEGDVFTIADVYAVNPVSGTAYSRLQQFVAGAAGVAGTSGTADGSGDVSAQVILPGTTPYELRSAGGTAIDDPYQNLSALPANDAAITIAGAASTNYAINLALHKNAMCLACVPLAVPEDAVIKESLTYKNIPMRLIKDYDFTNDRSLNRIDVFFGTKVIEPAAGCRIIGG